MTDYLFTASTADWTLTADTTVAAPEPLPARVLLAGLTASWAVEVIPPVTLPATAQFQVYDRGDDPDGWLSLREGEPIRLVLKPYPALKRLLLVDGRISDVAAVNHPDGGVIFTVTVTDRIGADLASTGGPRLMKAAYFGSGDVLSPSQIAYDQLNAEEGLNLTYVVDGTTPDLDLVIPTAGAPDPIDVGGQTLYEILTRYIIHDVRDFGFQETPQFATPPKLVVLNPKLADTTALTPQADAAYQLASYDPLDAGGVADVLDLVWTGSQWTLATNAAYAGTGIVLSAGQLLRDVGEWRKTRPTAINRVELTGTFRPDALLAASKQTVRRSFPDLVREFGPNTRTLDCVFDYQIAAQRLADVLLGGDTADSRPGGISQPTSLQALSKANRTLADAYGFTAVTIVWDRLTAAQIEAWAASLWPRNATRPQGRPLAIVDVPDEWRLSELGAVYGRLTGVTITADGKTIEVGLAMRQWPPITPAGAITYAQVGARAPTVTYANLDPRVSLGQLALVAGP